jgi:hypothetical protein
MQQFTMSFLWPIDDLVELMHVQMQQQALEYHHDQAEKAEQQQHDQEEKAIQEKHQLEELKEEYEECHIEQQEHQQAIMMMIMAMWRRLF